MMNHIRFGVHLLDRVIYWLAMVLISPVYLLHEMTHYAFAWLFGAGDRRMGLSYYTKTGRLGFRVTHLLGAFVYHDDESLSTWQDDVITFAPLLWFLPGYLIIHAGGQQYALLAVALWLTGASGISDVLQRLGLLDIGDGRPYDEMQMWYLIGHGPPTRAGYMS